MSLEILESLNSFLKKNKERFEIWCEYGPYYMVLQLRNLAKGFKRQSAFENFMVNILFI